MDYPDPDEEYELMHSDELELMNELEEDNFDFPSYVVSKRIPKVQLNFSNCAPAAPLEKSNTVKKPSNDEYPSDDDLLVLQEVPEPHTFERTPLASCDERSSSATDGPIPSTSRNAPTPSSEILLSASCYEPSSINDNDMIHISNKRTVSDLFGDITDLEVELSISSQTKRQKLEEEYALKVARQDLLIRTIVERRRKVNEDRTSFRLCCDQKVERLKNCICYGSVPKWPFIPASVKGERVYIRLHTEEKVQQDLKNVECKSRNTGLLGVSYKELYGLAMLEVAKKIDKIDYEKKPFPRLDSKNLWVEKYKPKIYLQLLSDEATNRSLLHWLKLWDKVVFNKEPKVLKHGSIVQDRRELLDEQGKPIQKVALLCGPPGLGKTTLAHMIAKQAGYCPIEVNASDDRSAQAFRTHLESATQMKSVIASNPNPNCLILDEIDGAPQAAVDVLIKYITDKNDSKFRKRKGQGILKRPIICICNDIYVPALRSLRQIAYTIVFPPTSSSRLGERLMEISKMEDLSTDLGTMMVLSEKSNNDIRSCLSILQYLKAMSPKVTLGQIHSSSVGCKDIQQGLFSVWETVFQIKLSKKGQGASVTSKTSNKPTSGKTTLNGSLAEVLQMVQSYGDYESLTNGIFENYAKVRSTESPIASVVKALDWFIFQDLLISRIQTSQNYSLYPYLPWAFLQWHILFASIQKPKLTYPTTFYDVSARILRNRQVLDCLLSGISPKLQSYQQRDNLLLDVVPLLVVLITPIVRPVSIQLYTQKEKEELHRVVGVMTDYNVNYSQMRTPEGHYNFLLDPNIEELVSYFDNLRENITSYTVRQLLSKEVKSEKIRRAAARSAIFNSEVQSKKKCITSVGHPNDEATLRAKHVLPNHLQKLTPKALEKKTVEVQARDFFGRVVKKSLASVESKAKTDEIVKSDIWFHFKEGYNNAVRKNVHISYLLS